MNKIETANRKSKPATLVTNEAEARSLNLEQGLVDIRALAYFTSNSERSIFNLMKGLIERLSEDIDIALAPEAFGREYKLTPTHSYVKTLKREGTAPCSPYRLPIACGVRLMRKRIGGKFIHFRIGKIVIYGDPVE